MKKTKKLSALILAVLMLFMMSMPVLADDATPVTSVDLTKTLEVGEEANTPTDSFAFTVTPSTNTTAPTDNTGYTGLELITGVTGGLTAPANISSTNAAATGGKTETMAVNAAVFTKPGIYRYEVKETTGSVKGMTYDDSTYIVDLYVEYNSSETLQVSEVIVSKNGTKADGLAFANMFKYKEDGGDLMHLTVSKTVTGNQGDRTKDFTFTVTYTTEGSRTLKYKKGSGEWTDISSGGTVTLKHGESFILGGLAEDDTWTVVETAADGYTQKVSVGGADATETTTATGTIVANTDATAAFTNTKEGTIPTGLFTNYKPFWIMGAAGIILALVFFRKRKNRFADEI